MSEIGRSVEVTFGDGFDGSTLQYAFAGLKGLTVDVNGLSGEVTEVTDEGILLDVPLELAASMPILIPWDDDLGGIVHIHVN